MAARGENGDENEGGMRTKWGISVAEIDRFDTATANHGKSVSELKPLEKGSFIESRVISDFCNLFMLFRRLSGE